MWPVVCELAWRQHAAFSAAQAVERGVSRSWLHRHLTEGRRLRRAPAVYALSGAPKTRRQDLIVHVLAAGDGALATGDSALGLWCPELVLPSRPVLVVPRWCGYRATGATVRRSTDLDLAVPGMVDGIPVVGVARALLDASVGRTPDEVLTRIDACRRHLPLSVGALTEALHRHARPGRKGITVYRRALRALTAKVPDSEFERLVVRDLVAAGVEEPRLHHMVRLPGQEPIELDPDWPGVPFDLELDGSDHVKRVRKKRRDDQRDRILQAAGYVVARYGWEDYLEDKGAMLAEVVALLDQCRSRPPAKS